jgi:hypothetical protein
MSEVLDLSHQELRKLTPINLHKINANRIDASYNYLKNLSNIVLIKNDTANSKQNNEMELNWLDLSFNFVSSIEEADGAHTFKNLRFLNMTANRIESVNITEQLYPNL